MKAAIRKFFCPIAEEEIEETECKTCPPPYPKNCPSKKELKTFKPEKLKPRKEAFKKWEYQIRDPLIFSKSLRRLNIDRIAKAMHMKNPDEEFKSELSFILSKFLKLSVCEVREVMPMPRKRPKVERSWFLPNRKIPNRPLYFLMTSLALFYEKWTNEIVKRENENFKEVVNYCIKSTGLSEVYPPKAVDRGVQTIIHKSMKNLRNELMIEYPSISLRDIDLTEIVPTYPLF